MKCFQCGFEMDDAAASCPNCGAEQGKVQILPPEERENFQGLTIEAERGPAGDDDYRGEGPRRRVYVHRVDLGSTPGGLFLKLIIAGVLLFLVIMALPLALLVIGVIFAGWLGSQFWRR